MNHSKLARIHNAAWKVLLRGSCNLNFNPRLEQVDLTEGDAAFDLVTAVEDALPVLPRLATHREHMEASKVADAFDLSALPMFSQVKPWAP